MMSDEKRECFVFSSSFITLHSSFLSGALRAMIKRLRRRKKGKVEGRKDRRAERRNNYRYDFQKKELTGVNKYVNIPL